MFTFRSAKQANYIHICTFIAHNTYIIQQPKDRRAPIFGWKEVDNIAALVLWHTRNMMATSTEFRKHFPVIFLFLTVLLVSLVSPSYANKRNKDVRLFILHNILLNLNYLYFAGMLNIFIYWFSCLKLH